MRRTLLILGVLSALAFVVVSVALHRGRHSGRLRVAIAPYQDLAMLVNAEPQGFTKKHNVSLELVTMAWEDILPAVASHGRTVDVGFGSLVEYLTKYEKLNSDAADPVVFVQPLYVYKGGGFVALKQSVPMLHAAALAKPTVVKEFLNLRIGAQKQSLYEMMVFTLARRTGLNASEVRVIDMSMNDGLLALQSNSLDVCAAGLTQLNEVKRRGGRLVLSMEDLRFADIVGFICLRSTLDARKTELEGLIHCWFDSVEYVLSDLRHNSNTSMEYLRRQAATEYTYEEYEAALGQEFLPPNLASLHRGLLADGAPYEIKRISEEIIAYLLQNDIVSTRPPTPEPLLSN